MIASISLYSIPQISSPDYKNSFFIIINNAATNIFVHRVYSQTHYLNKFSVIYSTDVYWIPIMLGPGNKWTKQTQPLPQRLNSLSFNNFQIFLSESQIQKGPSEWKTVGFAAKKHQLGSVEVTHRVAGKRNTPLSPPHQSLQESQDGEQNSSSFHSFVFLLKYNWLTMLYECTAKWYLYICTYI